MKSIIVILLCIGTIFALGPYPIDPSQISVGGISAGGFFAVQYQVAFSSQIMGAGIFAGGPFYCAQASEGFAFTECMYGFISIPIASLVSTTQSFASAGSIDPIKYLTTDRAFVYSGTEDTVVNPTVVQALATYYQQIGLDTNNISSQFSIPSEHCQPTNDYGNSCSFLGTPFIDNCNYDGAGAALQWIYGKLTPPTTPNNNNYFTFDQSDFTPNGEDPSDISFGPTGYLYVPKGCSNTTQEKKCRLHIVFHGCEQTIESIGEAFVQNSGYSKWAEANDIVILYPQATANLMLGNPNGCFDWWGYTGLLSPAYAQKSGPQMATVNNMVNAVLGINN